MERASSSGSKALFPKGPSFSLEDFSNKDFIVRDFVDGLAETAVPANRRSGPATQAFDPKPLIRTFESMFVFVRAVRAVRAYLADTNSLCRQMPCRS